jgi:ABC-type multidrug transport system fused ATPase/permease subunit
VATEAAVLDAIERLAKNGRTVVIIAHRLTTIARCDRVVRLHQGRLVSAGTFAQVVGDAPKAEGLVSRPR